MPLEQQRFEAAITTNRCTSKLVYVLNAIEYLLIVRPYTSPCFITSVYGFLPGLCIPATP